MQLELLFNKEKFSETEIDITSQIINGRHLCLLIHHLYNPPLLGESWLSLCKICGLFLCPVNQLWICLTVLLWTELCTWGPNF